VEMVKVSVWLPKHMVRSIEELVYRGVFINKSEAIRYALTKMLLMYDDVLREYRRSMICA